MRWNKNISLAIINRKLFIHIDAYRLWIEIKSRGKGIRKHLQREMVGPSLWIRKQDRDRQNGHLGSIPSEGPVLLTIEQCHIAGET